MTKKKSVTHKRNTPGKAQSRKRPVWLKVLRLIVLVVFAILLILALAGQVYRYYHLITNHG